LEGRRADFFSAEKAMRTPLDLHTQKITSEKNVRVGGQLDLPIKVDARQWSRRHAPFQQCPGHHLYDDSKGTKRERAAAPARIPRA
jgi:hypothetical protein